MFDLNKKKFYEHTSDFFSINQIDTNYNPNAKKIQAVDDFLDKISSFKAHRKQAILEMIGYSMTTSINIQKVFILYGETARNGKSTLSNVITKLIGKNNISNISLKDMTKNTFATFGIKGKLLNIGAEMTETFLDDMSTFKMFSTGDNLSVEEKFKSRHTISPYAKFIFIANELPSVSDKTNAFYRRLHVIPLETTFTDKDSKNFNIKDILCTDALEYLAKISLDAYMSMDNVFSNYEESEKIIDKYKLESNSILSFIKDEETIRDLTKEGKNITAKTVYNYYRDFCIANKYLYIGRNKFYSEIEKTGFITPNYVNNQKHYLFK